MSTAFPRPSLRRLLVEGPPSLALTLLALTLLACGGGPAGLPCERTRECPTGQTCWTRVSETHAFEGGFCTRTCERAGHTDGCPTDSVCALSAERLLCAPTCEGEGEEACGEHLTCAPSDLEGGPRACVLRP